MHFKINNFFLLPVQLYLLDRKKKKNKTQIERFKKMKEKVITAYNNHDRIVTI